MEINNLPRGGRGPLERISNFSAAERAEKGKTDGLVEELAHRQVQEPF
jgi:hypothetical protein